MAKLLVDLYEHIQQGAALHAGTMLNVLEDTEQYGSAPRCHEATNDANYKAGAALHELG